MQENRTWNRLKDEELIETLKSMNTSELYPANAQKVYEALKDKYAVTLVDVEKDIVEAETTLSKMLNELTGADEDMAGLAEWRKLLGGK